MMKKPSRPLPEFLPEKVENRSVTEPARQIPVLARCDVAVFGGGPAGVCAAAAAAREGKRVILVERHGFLGGVATAANVNIWHSFFGSDGETQIISGIAEEITTELMGQHAARNSKPNGTGHWEVCTETTKLVLDDLSLGSGVRLLLHTLLCDVIVEKGRVVAALVESKSGRHAIEADVFIDATGDADLVRRTGLATQNGDATGGCQPPSLCFRLGGMNDEVLYSNMQGMLFSEPMDYNGANYPCFLWGNRGIHERSDHLFAGTRVPGVDASKVDDLTRAEVEARYQMRWVISRLKALPGGEKLFLRDIATQIGVRETHRILADYQVNRREILEGVPFEDAIAFGTYPIDIHNPTGPGIIFERLSGEVLEVSGEGKHFYSRWDGAPEGAPLRDTLCWSLPYRSLIPRGLENVLATGRCIGADHEAAGAIRVMVTAMQTGQAAGVAAALCRNGAVRCVETERLLGALTAQGAKIVAPA